MLLFNTRPLHLFDFKMYPRNELFPNATYAASYQQLPLHVASPRFEMPLPKVHPFQEYFSSRMVSPQNFQNQGKPTTPTSSYSAIEQLRLQKATLQKNEQGFMDFSHMHQTLTFDGGKKTYRCTQCFYVTDRKNNLKRHEDTMHQDCGKLLECCEMTFNKKADLREHVLLFHRHGYTCKYCERSFCRKALLKRHISVHSGAKNFVCNQCDYATTHKSNLDRHSKTHTTSTQLWPESSPINDAIATSETESESTRVPEAQDNLSRDFKRQKHQDFSLQKEPTDITYRQRLIVDKRAEGISPRAGLRLTPPQIKGEKAILKNAAKSTFFSRTRGSLVLAHSEASDNGENVVSSTTNCPTEKVTSNEKSETESQQHSSMPSSNAGNDTKKPKLFRPYALDDA